ncbi:Pisatin demethylase [Pleurostoma richardsiae]|uniref:Cytochrome P450 monooxygenase ABA1 n=1 Tax=Pleurostoma richardsiae TaxID=41990 RepID=A0AA38RUV0_9PEZI|nr:Pisatin demethylase [Pleurostoma richardsiae]
MVDYYHLCASGLSRLTSTGGMASLLVIILLAYYVAVTYYSYQRLSHIPGPRGAGFSKWWMLRNTLSGNMHLALKRACDDYGLLARVGPNTLVTNDPEVIKRMWTVRSPYKKGEFYDAVRFDPTRDNLISMRDDNLHNELRAKMAAGYGGKDNEGLEGAIDKEIACFINLIERKYLSTDTEFRPLDLARKAQYFTLDVISSLAFGKKFGFLDQDKDVHQYIQMTEESMPVMMILTVIPSLARLLQTKLLRRLMPSEHDRVGFGKFIAVAKQVVAERLASSNPFQKDMLGSFLKHGLTQEEAEGETLVQVIAGSDTTATAIRTTMLYLMTSPLAYDKLTREIRAAAAEGRISQPITDAESRTLPYLQAVIREGLRIFPPVAGLMPTVVPRGGDVIHGLAVPEGTDIGWTAFGVQHSREVYGADAELFRPERWLEASEEQLKTMTGTWELIFKYGKWQCLGKSVALLELNKIFVELLRRYDFTLLNPSSPWYSANAGIFIQSDEWVKVTRAP